MKRKRALVIIGCVAVGLLSAIVYSREISIWFLLSGYNSAVSPNANKVASALWRNSVDIETPDIYWGTLGLEGVKVDHCGLLTDNYALASAYCPHDNIIRHVILVKIKNKWYADRVFLTKSAG